MADINAAWRVLSDPGRRAVYDASLRNGQAGGALDAGDIDGDADDDLDDDLDDDSDFVPGRHPLGRFGIPLPWIAILGVLAVIFVFTAYAASSRSHPGGNDGVLDVGSCVRVVAADTVEKASCGGANDGRVTSLPQIGASCPAGHDSYHDRKSVMRVCVGPH